MTEKLEDAASQPASEDKRIMIRFPGELLDALEQAKPTILKSNPGYGRSQADLIRLCVSRYVSGINKRR